MFYCVFTSLMAPEPHKEKSVLWSIKAAVFTYILTCKRVSVPTKKNKPQSNIHIMGCCFPGDEQSGTLTLSPNIVRIKIKPDDAPKLPESPDLHSTACVRGE